MTGLIELQKDLDESIECLRLQLPAISRFIESFPNFERLVPSSSTATIRGITEQEARSPGELIVSAMRQRPSDLDLDAEANSEIVATSENHVLSQYRRTSFISSTPGPVHSFESSLLEAADTRVLKDQQNLESYEKNYPVNIVNEEEHLATAIASKELSPEPPSFRSIGTIDLEEMLRASAIKHEDKGLFWTDSILKKVITLDRSKLQLCANGIQANQLDEWSHSILSAALKVFVVLILIGKQRSICEFVGAGITDTTLPLIADSIDPSIVPENAVSNCFSDWDPRDRDAFFLYQHRVKPVVLELQHGQYNPNHVDLEFNDVLPFMHSEMIQEGTYGVVKKVEIHPDCHNFGEILPSVGVLP